jgi:1-acyl-sn-glycerol-3-phosphate acyltransferase
MKRPEDQFPIRVLYAVNRLFTRVYHDLTVLTPPRLPESGAAILVCNHISGLDPLFLQSAVDRRLIQWMMAKEYLDLPGLGKVFRTLEIIPIDRGSRETAPFRTALRQLKAGRVVGIFPEGKIGTGGLLPLQTGTALLAIRTKSPVYPAYLDGTQRGREMIHAFASPCRAVVSFGAPIDLSGLETDRGSLLAATDRIRDGIEREKNKIVDFHKVR